MGGLEAEVDIPEHVGARPCPGQQREIPPMRLPAEGRRWGPRGELAGEVVVMHFERVPRHAPRRRVPLDQRMARDGVGEDVSVGALVVGIQDRHLPHARFPSSAVQSRIAASSRPRAPAKLRPRLSTQIDATQRDHMPRCGEALSGPAEGCVSRRPMTGGSPRARCHAEHLRRTDGYLSLSGGVQPTRTAQFSAARMMRSQAGSLTTYTRSSRRRPQQPTHA